MKNKIDESMIYYFRHFSLRLSERYGILISFEEYVHHCNHSELVRPKQFQNNGKHPCLHGFINIDGNAVCVLKEYKKPGNFLLTALPLNGKDKKTAKSIMKSFIT